MLEDGSLHQTGLGRYAVPPPTRIPSPRQPRAAPRDAAPNQDPAPARPTRRRDDRSFPTVAQLTAELRRQPAGVVLAGICRDLGITPHYPLWGKASRAVVAWGGRLAELEQDADTRWCSKRWLEIPVVRPPFIPACLWPKWLPQPAPQAAIVGATSRP